MASLSSKVGDELVFKGDTVKTSLLENDNKVVGLYFSAHWCPPCRGFTPELVAWYNKFKEGDRAEEMDIIFISSDRDQKSFDDYYAEMPWHSLAFEKRDIKAKISKKFGVQGIPSLIFLHAKSGQVITKNGREAVVKDPTGEGFPYTPKPLADIMKGNLLTKNGTKDFSEMVEGKYRALYFSAHWCPPCRGFTPELVKTYKKLQEDGQPLEIIFISWDRDEDAFDDYFGEMPWTAFPYEDPRIEELNSHFEISGIPSLILLDQENKVIRKDGRAAVSSDPEGKEFPWFPKPLNPLNSSSAGSVNEMANVLYFSGSKADEAEELLGEIATNYKKEQDKNPELEELGFLYEGADEKSKEISKSIKNFLGLSTDSDDPLVILIDIPGQGKYIGATNPSKEEIESIVNQFKEGKLTMEPLK